MLQSENKLLKKQILDLKAEASIKPFSTIPFLIIYSSLILINNAQELFFGFIAPKKH